MADIVDPYQTLHYVASDLSLHCSPMTPLQVSTVIEEVGKVKEPTSTKIVAILSLPMLFVNPHFIVDVAFLLCLSLNVKCRLNDIIPCNNIVSLQKHIRQSLVKYILTYHSKGMFLFFSSFFLFVF